MAGPSLGPDAFVSRNALLTFFLFLLELGSRCLSLMGHDNDNDDDDDDESM
jgi:hypothetical protein